MNYINVKAGRRLVTTEMKGGGYMTRYAILFVYPRDFSAWGETRRQSRANFRKMRKEAALWNN